MTQKVMFTFEECRQRLELLEIDYPHFVVYGVPNGGKEVARLLKRAQVTTDIRKAHVILDDIIDSGKTRDEVMEMEEVRSSAVFLALIDKVGNMRDEQLGWIVFPWEDPNAPAEVSGLDIKERIRAEMEG